MRGLLVGTWTTCGHFVKFRTCEFNACLWVKVKTRGQVHTNEGPVGVHLDNLWTIYEIQNTLDACLRVKERARG